MRTLYNQESGDLNDPLKPAWLNDDLDASVYASEQLNHKALVEAAENTKDME